MPGRPRLLLHVCCGPCATAVIERLAPAYDLTPYWFNPNIQPPEEYVERLAAALKLGARLGMPLVVEGEGETSFAALAEGREQELEGGERCRLCYELRLRQAMNYAASHAFSHVATTLTVSPHKSAEVINEIGWRLAREKCLEFISEDFKRAGGFQRSVELSKQHSLYRQRYCGCLASLRQRGE